jgi:hypothetical protein
MFRRLVHYLEKTWDFSELRATVRDSRHYCAIPAGDIFASVFILFCITHKELQYDGAEPQSEQTVYRAL